MENLKNCKIKIKKIRDRCRKKRKSKLERE